MSMSRLVKIEVTRTVKQLCEFYIEVPEVMTFGNVQALAYNKYVYGLEDDEFTTQDTNIEEVNICIPKP